MRWLWAMSVALSVSGCASESPRVLRFAATSDGADRSGPVWPGPPEPPRYAYVGELTGEANFVAAGSSSSDGFGEVFALIVGLGQEQHKPVVLQRPQAVISDDLGRVYVSDVSRRAVFVFDERQGRLLLWDRASAERRFVSPIGLALGQGDKIYVADADLALVAELDGNGRPVAQIGRGVLQRPTGIAFDSAASRLYVADTGASDIKVFAATGELLDTLGHAGDGPGALNSPTYIAVSKRLLYVTDTLNARVQVLDEQGDPVREFGQRGLYVGNLTRPKGISVDNDGHVYVIESFYDHMLVFNEQGRFLLPIGGTGHAPGQFYLPAGIYADARGRVYVADMFNGRVSVFQFLGDTP